MLKQAAIFEIKKEDRIYTLTLPNTAPLGELHDVIYQMRAFVVEKINESIKAEMPKENAKEVPESPKEE